MPRRNTRSTRSTVEIGGNTTIGETVQLNGPSNMIRLPDGTVVTARGEYVVRHEGEHTVIHGDHEDTFTGVKAKKD